MSGKLSGKQEQALIALLTEATVEAAAAKAGMNARTLFRWLNDPPFVAAYRAARRQAVQRATGRLQQAASDAVTTLQDVMTDAAAPAPARVSAAKSVLELAVKAVEIEDLTACIEALEQAPARPALGTSS
jgi:hypothetical protein